MIHLGYNRSGDAFHASTVSTASQSVSHHQSALPYTGTGHPWTIQASYSPSTPPTNTDSQPDRRNAVVHWMQAGQSYTSGGRSDDEEGSRDSAYRPFTPPPPRERLSYTRYQLELLNGVYNHVKYPNSTQKHLIAKRVGITRDQVKIWFQNRRRKDVLAKQGRRDDCDGKLTPNGSPGSLSVEGSDENRGEGMVPSVVMDSIISELVKYKNEHLKSKKQKSRKKTTEQTKLKPSLGNLSDGSERLSQQWGLFSGYDMVSPPNQITPSAFAKMSSMNQISENAKQSAFERPKQQHVPSRRSSPLSYMNYDCSQSHARFTNNHCGLDTYQSNYNPLNEMNTAHTDRSGNGLHSDRPNRSQEDTTDFVRCRTINRSQNPNDNCHILSNISHTDTIPVLSDLLEHSQRHASSATKSRDTLWYTANNRRMEDEHGLTTLPLSYSNYLPFDTTSSNRVPLTFPFSTEPVVSGSCTRLSDPCRPQPHYPLSFAHQDPFPTIQGSSLNNQYFMHHQSSSVSPDHSWNDSSYPEPSFVQL